MLRALWFLYRPSWLVRPDPGTARVGQQSKSDKLVGPVRDPSAIDPGTLGSYSSCQTESQGTASQHLEGSFKGSSYAEGRGVEPVSARCLWILLRPPRNLSKKRRLMSTASSISCPFCQLASELYHPWLASSLCTAQSGGYAAASDDVEKSAPSKIPKAARRGHLVHRRGRPGRQGTLAHPGKRLLKMP